MAVRRAAKTEKQSRRWADEERKGEGIERQSPAKRRRITFLRRPVERRREIDGWQSSSRIPHPGGKRSKIRGAARLLTAQRSRTCSVNRTGCGGETEPKLLDDDIHIYDEKRLD